VCPNIGLRGGHESALAVVREAMEPAVSPMAVSLPTDATSLMDLDRLPATPAVQDVRGYQRIAAETN